MPKLKKKAICSGRTDTPNYRKASLLKRLHIYMRFMYSVKVKSGLKKGYNISKKILLDEA